MRLWCSIPVGVTTPLEKEPLPLVASEEKSRTVTIFLGVVWGIRDMNQQSPVIGIDLGTTFSVCAVLTPSGDPQTVLTPTGEHNIPSVVAFDRENVLVGLRAKMMLSRHPDFVIEHAKRYMGERVFPKEIDGRYYAPEVISGLVLARLRSNLIRRIGSCDRAVVTVPAYFDEVRRKATQDAAYLAGLEVLELLNEPTAAAIAFGYHQGFIDGEEMLAGGPKYVMVYDLGGGTFDVTLMKIDGNDYQVLATDGDCRLGGIDWDQRLVDLVAEHWIRTADLDPREDSKTLAQLENVCEKAKQSLSRRQKAEISLDTGSGEILSMNVTRAVFEEETADLVERTRFTMNEVLRAAGMTWAGVDRVLLTGGSTRMPMIRNMVDRVSGKRADTSIAPDEAVAHGAALRAGLLLSERAGVPAKYRIANVNSHTLGVVGIDQETGRRRVGPIIKRNTTIPVAKRRTFQTCRHGQRTLQIEIVEGENPNPDACTLIGCCKIRNLPEGLPMATPVVVVFRYATDGRLDVKVRLKELGKEATATFLRSSGLSKEDLDTWRHFISGLPPAE